MGKILFVIFVLVSLCPILLCDTTIHNKTKATYESLYRSGVDAYLQNKWYECVAFIEKSLEDYFYHRFVVLKCRRHCQNDTGLISECDTKSGSSVNNLFDFAIKRASCLSKCDQAYFEDRPKTSKEVEDDFQKKVPYNYLQLCHFKADNLELAASYAYTFLIHNPDSDVMHKNLLYYMELEHLNKKNIRNMEIQEYQELYIYAVHAYERQSYDEVINVMEKALKEYFLAEENCRLLCEGPIKDISNEELYIAIANHFVQVLQCKIRCHIRLSNIHGQKHHNLLSSYYHYLQFGYYKTHQIQKACQAVASYLLLYPDDEIMKTNSDFYSKQEGFKQEWFTPREEVVNYHKRLTEESRFMSNIADYFKRMGDKSIVSTPPLDSSNTIVSQAKNSNPSQSPAQDWLVKMGISVSLKERELNGTKRVALEGLATEEECKQLISLTSEGGLHGDGYNWRESPHTEFEMFDGLAISRASLMSQRGLLNPVTVQSFLTISDKGRKAVETYFNLTSELYFAYTHLVCRTAVPNSPFDRVDLSHPIHADNCVLLENGNCIKERPAYTWRDYSAIIYLNDNFEGGEFIFAEDKVTIQAAVKPKCGLMVAFSAGKENLHGVKAVRKGQRCALAMWYTLNPQYKEGERDFAQQILTHALERKELLKDNANNADIIKARINSFLGLKDQITDRTKITSNHVHSEL